MTKTILKTIIALTAIFNLALTGSARQRYPENPQIIENSLGVIVLGRNYGKQDFIHIYNRDGSIWYKFTYYYDERSGQFPYKNSNFKPFAFHPDYFVLALKCVRKVRDQYEVIVNEESGLKKYIKANDSALAFEPWSQHVLTVFSVDFNPAKNPLLKTRQGQRRAIPPKDTFFHPVKVEGNWLMIEWVIKRRTSAEKEKYAYGWVKWRDKKKLLVELSYLC